MNDGIVTKTKYFSVGKYVGGLTGTQRNGKGILNYFSGDKYEGEWRGNLFHGRGVFEWPDGRRYEGEWNFDAMEGTGSYSWPDGAKYEGQFHAGKKDGHGTQSWASGNSYEGEWVCGNMQGDGIFSWSDGLVYEGKWKSNSIDRGQGNFKTSSGQKFPYAPIPGLLPPVPPSRNSDIPVFEKEIRNQNDLQDVEEKVIETLASDGRVTAKCNFFHTSEYMHFRMLIFFNKEACMKSISYHGMTLELEAWRGGPTFPELRICVLKVKLRDKSQSM